MHINKIYFAFSLLVFACVSISAVASENPFLTPSERKAASKPQDCPVQELSNVPTAESISEQEELKMLLNDKKEEASTANRYVGSINGKDVYFNEDKKAYIYRNSNNLN